MPVTRVRSAAIVPIRDFWAVRLIWPRAFSGVPMKVIMPFIAASPLSPAVSTCDHDPGLGVELAERLAEAAVDLSRGC